MDKNYEIATFAGGCFWCTENAIEKLPGVIEVISGYSGGNVENPTYEQVSSGSTGHYESIQVKFDPKIISYAELLASYWRQIDPTSAIGQFTDIGLQYRTAIFYHNQNQKEEAEKSKKKIDESGRFCKPVATQILPYKNFYPAEEYYQNYARKNPRDYQKYVIGSGRKDKLKKIWKKDE